MTTTAVRERGILFKGHLVRAILEGRKTQTRRVVQPQPVGAWAAPGRQSGPYGRIGDRLWVRETHAIVPATAYRASHDDGVPLPRAVSPDGYYWAVYREGWTRSAPGRWRPSIHMPRWASRLTLEITDVRVERIHDITAQDAWAEGIRPRGVAAHAGDGTTDSVDPQAAVLDEFRDTWDEINAKRGFGWAANPWVWAITFRKLEAKDEM